MIKLKRLRCSFCRKNEREVSKLVAGPRVYICDRCVAVASKMMEDDSHDDSQPADAGQSVRRKWSSRVRQFLRGGGGSARRVHSPTVSS